MFSGVSKSGSPGPKSITSTPLSFRALASIITARVGEMLTAESLPARRMSLDVMSPLHGGGAASPRQGSRAARSAPRARREALFQPGRHLGGHEPGHVAPEAGHF